MATIRKRRIEITAVEHARLTLTSITAHCEVCSKRSEMLTPAAAGQLVQVDLDTMLSWLMDGRVHGMRTINGKVRVCSNSLFLEGDK